MPDSRSGTRRGGSAPTSVAAPHRRKVGPPAQASRQQPPAPFRGVVALDGPSGTGKSTVARRLAVRLGARYLDTGAMYRAATVAVMRAGADERDPSAVVEALSDNLIEVSTDPTKPAVRLNGDPIDAEIRTDEVTARVSAVSAVPRVREQLVALQRQIIGAGGIVVEGRDIATVVWPAADPKIYLTASAEVRARRRAGELGAQADLAAVAADIERRDRLDTTRATSPLAQAQSAIVLDTTHLDINQVVSRLVDITTLHPDG